MYNHRRIDYEVELDACLDDLGALWKYFVYHVIMDLLPRWSITENNVKTLHTYVENPLWLKPGLDFLALGV